MIPVKAYVNNSQGKNTIQLTTGGKRQSIQIDTQAGGKGLDTRGGELLFLAMASCLVNDIYREARLMDIDVQAVEVTVEGDFEGPPGCVAEKVRYLMKVTANASEEAILEMIERTDAVAEIPNTLEMATNVELLPGVAVSTL